MYKLYGVFTFFLNATWPNACFENIMRKRTIVKPKADAGNGSQQKEEYSVKVIHKRTG